MNRKNVVVIFCIVLSVTIGLAFEGKTNFAMKTLGLSQPSETDLSAQQTVVKPAAAVPPSQAVPQRKELIPADQKAEVPEYILYDQMFRLIAKFKKKAEEQEGKGEQALWFRDYFQKEANLSDGQTVILQDSALKFVAEVEVVDMQARVIIENIRAKIPRGQPITDKKVLEPPVELKALQKKREELALHYRDQLREQLGSEQFQNIDNYVHQELTRSISGVQVDGSKLTPTVDEITPATRYPISPNGGIRK